MAQYLYGKNVVNQLLKSRSPIEELYLKKGVIDQATLAKLNCKITYLERNELTKLAKSENHQGVVAKVKEYQIYSLNEILNDIPNGENGVLVMLDGIEDPHNLGAILRSCDCVGAHGVIIKKDRSVSLNATVAKTSTGAIDTVKVAQVTNLASTIDELKKKGYWVVGASMNNAVDYRSINYDFPVVLVIGSEGFGISQLVEKKCDYHAYIPMVGQINSLNASVATAVFLYQIFSSQHPLK